MTIPPKPPKHHYIPVFYLREWTNHEGRLIEFSRPTGQEVQPRATAPKGTGFVRGLYRLDHLSGDAAEAFERFFFSLVDNLAKDSMDILLGRREVPFDHRSRSAWSRFVLGMLFRNPERLSATRKYVEDFTLDNYERDKIAYEAQKAEDDPEYIEYLVRNVAFTTMDWIKGMLESSKLGQHMNNMYWSVRDVSDGGLKLFTSDRPVVMTNGLGYNWSNLVMPISPTKAFMATNTVEIMQQLKGMSTMEFIKLSNEKVLKYAQKFAWNTNADQINVARRYLSLDAEVSRTF
ncbi:DUF4238 domain-containing protein (plasmid) [Bradyrhizobium sp. 155]|uniref:DUF4238 domain-containing protein n=1 Tax=unclassified Bradyrhizobium TaxID=2631580 RepID=UPI001FFF2903|nr:MULTISPECIES: DUF4238 domain-containing protein [unclassified Bradyrhizobium]UPK15813.1 DUF4238 domain-containing protein [Bradyrhizobium sp. 155]UPK23442.1 DUF4238 domain-containing protein [Bradyrhizobium sp. 131]